MAIKLKAPSIPATDSASPESQPATNMDRARFIQGAERRPDGGKPQSRTYRLSQAFIDVIEEESMRSSMGNTDVIKAALYGLSLQDENTRNAWLLGSKKM